MSADNLQNAAQQPLFNLAQDEGSRKTIQGEPFGFRLHMSYQHDLLLLEGDTLKVIGALKTSSKDRLDKIFLDKFLYSKLTGTTLPHVAIFLNDVQRKRAPRENQYRIDSTFLPGHFKGFTIKLNPLDGVYYCDMRPIMQTDPLLKDHIRTIDHFLCTDVWRLLGRDNP
jgi:hypothetical protein